MKVQGSREFDAEVDTEVVDDYETDFQGNWEEVRGVLGLDTRDAEGSEALMKAVEANSISAQRALFGGPVMLPDDFNRTLRSATRGGTVARAFWWGFHIQISHEDIRIFVETANGIQTVLGAISAILPAVIRPFVGVVRVFLEASKAILTALDRGRGVYISMSWFAPGIMVPTSVV